MRIAVADGQSGQEAGVVSTLEAAGAGAAPDLIIAFAAEQDFDRLLAQLRAGFPGVQLLVATSCQGVMRAGPDSDFDAGCDTRRGGALGDRRCAPSFGAMAFFDPAGAFGAGAADFGRQAPRAAAAEAIGRAIEDAGRAGEAPALIWMAAAPGSEEEVIAGLQEVVGANTPILGGSSADDAVSGRWAQATQTTRHHNGLVLAALFPSKGVSFAYSSGYAPTTRSGVATRTEGRRLFEIDGQPAAAVYQSWCGAIGEPGSTQRPILQQSTFHPLGRAVGAVGGVADFVMAHPATVYPDGSLGLFATVDAGERLRLMSGDVERLVRRAGRVAEAALRREAWRQDDVAGALMVYCAGCMMAVGDRMGEVAAGVHHVLNPIPTLGAFTFGEQGRCSSGVNRHGNLMISCVLFEK